MTAPATPIRTKPRKIPRQARSEDTVRIILEAAARILESHGLAGFTTNAVAERAGVSIGSLYQYFPGKDALTGALIAKQAAALLEDVAVAVREPSGHAAVVELIAAAVRHQLRRPALARLLDFEEVRLPLDEEVSGLAERLRASLAEVLLRPDLPPQDCVTVAAADVFAIVKGIVDAAGERGEIDPHALERRVGRAVFGYLGAG
jgi:AcrR family transcriptional regulator